MAAENRRAKRDPHDSVLELFDDSGKLITGIGRLVNVSKTGACFSSTKTYEKGKPLRARIRTLRDGVTECAAEIVWVRKKPTVTLYGVRFLA